MGFLSHNSGSRHARWSIKSSRDADDHLVSKTFLSQKDGSLDGHPGPGDVCEKCKSMPSLLRHQQKTPNPKRNYFFPILARRLAESVDGLNSFLAQSAGVL